MTQAQYWTAICRDRVVAPANECLLSPWSRRTLEDAATTTIVTGANRRVWNFADGSQLEVQPEGVVVR